MGVQPVKVKLIVTMISAALTSVGGFLYAQYILFLDPPSVFSINISVQIALDGSAARVDFQADLDIEDDGDALLLFRSHLVWMARLAEFRPHLGGAVWHGTATRKSDIYPQLFCDDSKSAEIALIDQRLAYVARTITGFNGESVEA